MKRLFLFLILFLIFPFFFCEVQAVSPQDIESYVGTDSIYEALPDSVSREDLTPFQEKGESANLLQHLFSLVRDYLSCGFRDSLTFFSGLCTLLLFSALFGAMKKSFFTKTESAFDLLFLLVLAVFSYTFFSQSVKTVQSTMTALNGFLLALIPVQSLLLSLSGAVQSAAVQSSHLIFVLSALSTFSLSFLFPLVRTFFCFSFFQGAGIKELAGPIRFLQKTARLFCIFFFTLASGILAIQNALAAAKDSLLMRSVRFAAGSFIPVIGSAVGESAKTLAASFELVKAQSGTLCLWILLLVLLRPILTLWIQKFFLGLAAAIGEILGESRCKQFLSSLSGVLDLMMTLLISQGCYVIFAVTLFIQTRGNL